MILSNPLINASIFYFCYALEDRLQFLCSPLGLVMAIPLTQYVPSSKRGQGTLIYVGEDRWGRTIARSPLFIYFYFFPLACIFANFPILDFISAAHWWNNISVLHPVHFGGNFLALHCQFHPHFREYDVEQITQKSPALASGKAGRVCHSLPVKSR